MSGDRWDPKRYERFASDRERPFWDLAALLAPTDAPRLADERAGEPIPHTILDIDEYSRLLDDLGFSEQHVRAQAYPARLPSRDEAIDWLRGSGLTHYERTLPADRYAQLVSELRESLPDERPFRLTYVRVLLWGRLRG